ncbi:MAG TPA: PKD domain-containing protein, partial [Thermoplasmata archaeon]|nr:PKD domain-containing protein [Thermoplasmata archaeon]
KALGVAIQAASLDVAPGFALNFTAVATNGSGSYSRYAWTFPDGSSATGRTAAHTFPLAGGNGSVSVAVTDTHGQTGRAVATVTVAAIVVAIGSLPTSARTGASLTFTASAVGGAGAPYSFVWAFGDGSGATGPTTTHSFGKAASYVPTVRVTDRLGASTVVVAPTVAVTTPPPPAPLLPWWAVAALLVAVLAVVFVLLLGRRRRKASEKLRSSAPWAPPTAPKHTVLGSKICTSCGSSNVRLRTTCEVCGTDLPSR